MRDLEDRFGGSFLTEEVFEGTGQDHAALSPGGRILHLIGDGEAGENENEIAV